MGNAQVVLMVQGKRAFVLTRVFSQKRVAAQMMKVLLDESELEVYQGKGSEHG